MIKFSIVIFILASMFVVTSYTSKTDLFVSYSNPQIIYSGRIDTSQIQAAELYCSDTSVTINFEGESIQALLKDNKGDNYYNVIVDNDSIFT